MNRGESLTELPRMFPRQGSAPKPPQEGRKSEGENSEASSHVDQLISAFEHISSQQPETLAIDAGDTFRALCQCDLLIIMHAESSWTSKSLAATRLNEDSCLTEVDRPAVFFPCSSVQG